MAEQTYVAEKSVMADLAPSERADSWSEHTRAYQCRLDLDFGGAEDFDGWMVRQWSPGYQVVNFWSDQIRYTRTPQQARFDPDEDYRFLLPLHGEALISQAGQETPVRPGTGMLMTLTEPFDMVQDSYLRGLVMTIPAREVNESLNRTCPLAAGVDMTRGLGRVVNDMFTGLFEERDHLTRVQFDAIGARLVELLCMLVVGDDRPGTPGHLAEVEAMVRRYVSAHAADPDLTGASMAQALGWSLRQVQLALQHAGTTPRDLIREERLRLVRDRLKSPAYRHMTITDIAHTCGFSSASALSTAFRQRYGVSPREMRR